MQSVTGRVTIGEDEAATVVELVERVYIEQNFIEDRDDMDWVRERAETVVDAFRVGHVGLVIGRVEVYTIPAGREKDLSPEPIWAVGVAVESWSLVLVRSIVVEAGRNFRLIVIMKLRERD